MYIRSYGFTFFSTTLMCDYHIGERIELNEKGT